MQPVMLFSTQLAVAVFMTSCLVQIKLGGSGPKCGDTARKPDLSPFAARWRAEGGGGGWGERRYFCCLPGQSVNFGPNLSGPTPGARQWKLHHVHTKWRTPNTKQIWYQWLLLSWKDPPTMSNIDWITLLIDNNENMCVPRSIKIDRKTV